MTAVPLQEKAPPSPQPVEAVAEMLIWARKSGIPEEGVNVTEGALRSTKIGVVETSVRPLSDYVVVVNPESTGVSRPLIRTV